MILSATLARTYEAVRLTVEILQGGRRSIEATPRLLAQIQGLTDQRAAFRAKWPTRDAEELVVLSTSMRDPRFIQDR